MSSLIHALQAAVTDRLRRLPEMQGLPVLARQPKQTLDEIEAGLAGLSLGYFVFPPLYRQIRPNSTGLFAEEIEVRVSCFENPALNDGALDAYRLVELCLYHLHHWQPLGSALPLVSMLYAREQPVSDTSTADLVVFDVVFSCSGGFEARPGPLFAAPAYVAPLPPPPPSDSAYALRNPINGAYRIKTVASGSYLQVKNATTGAWHTLFAAGAAGAEFLTIGPAD